MGEPCQVCGGNGCEELIADCSRCGAREHAYCMRVTSFDVTGDWFCDECQSLSSGENRVDLECPVGGSNSAKHKGCLRARLECPMPRWKKTPEITKVKLLSAEEAVKLASGQSRRVPPSPHSLGSPNFKLNHGCHNSKVIRIGECSQTRPSSGEHYPIIRPPSTGVERGSLNFNKYTSKISELPADLTDLKTVKNSEPTCAYQQWLFKINPHPFWQFPDKKVACFRGCEPGHRKERSVAEEAAKEAQSATLAQIQCSEEGTDFHVAPGARNSILPKLRLYRPYLPALHATWKGGFKLMDSAASGNFYRGFRAQPPSTLYQKPYNFSKKMDPILQVELLSVDSILRDFFGCKYPDLSDIALYLFPDNVIESSQQNNARLIELMQVQKSAIRSRIEGAELLVFTSEQLCGDSQSVIRVAKASKAFLWGIFHTINSPPQGTSQVEVCSDPKDEASGMVIDMEIDTVGGRLTGKVAVPVPKKDYEVKLVSVTRKTVETRTLPKTDATTSTGRAYPDVPPGFEGKNSALNSRNVAGTAASTAIAGPSGSMAGTGKHDQKTSNEKTTFPLVSTPTGLKQITRNSSDSKTTDCRTPTVHKQVALTPNPGRPDLWIPPPMNWVKLNAEGISKGDPGPAGAAGVARDEFGNWLFGYVHNLGTFTRLAAEFWAIFQGLTLLWERGYKQILIESASSEAVQALTGEAPPTGSTLRLVRSCKELLSRNWTCQISVIPGCKNLCANWLANRFTQQRPGLNVMYEPHGSLIPLLEMDRTLSCSASQSLK